MTAGDERADAFLVVRPEPGAPGRAPILLVLSTCTWNAYNDWGGPSLYTGAHQVSFERPLAPGFLVKPEPHERKAQAVPDREALGFFRWAEPLGLSIWSGGAGWWNWERTALRWAEANGFAVDVAIQQDLEDVPGLLDGVRLYLSVGHDEYWTWGMREALDAHTAAGGNAAILSGNTCYWQVRIDEDRRTMTGYKYDADEDPVDRDAGRAVPLGSVGGPTDRPAGDRDDRAHVQPRRLLALRPRRPARERRLHGLATRALGLRGHAASAYGDALGLADAIVGYEVDGCELTTGPDGLPVPDAPRRRARIPSRSSRPRPPSSGPRTSSRRATRTSPASSRTSPRPSTARRGADHLEEFRYNHAVCGVFTTPGGGTVFNAGVTDWAYGLRGNDPALERVTRNVLERLSR